ncbi:MULTISPECIES: flagellar basal body L-ring protein FlgH [Photobacterium]|uniref:Flagellar L-ring protein n=1 Tax=Photobacterium halotolerans TaxID=265726 RepID=A0A0F5VCG5_9GAMM|nr:MULTISPECIES: flagellar basal body L-ring protein FlgH [Photobacterium]KKC99813.1 flagellar basal body L-ring protein [Photobacterium halotolerans]UIP29180.1 flagellar basal body L-ring protein FlgH [Photobacterium sp. TLY01]
MKWLIPFLMVLLTGCTMRPEFSAPEPDDEAFAPPVLDYSLPEASDGSLYRNNYMMTLFQDRRAYRVGDILTIVLDEETQSSKKANTQFSKDSEVGISAPVFGNYTADNLSASVDASRGFDGSSQSSQGNKLKGAITVTVNAVLPNGVLRVRGEKWLRLNQGDEFIRLSGIVRVDDINRLNQVSSQRIGDARITYSGRGALADSNSAGWLTQFFTSPWMPF